jgi:hypothetical protein
MNMTFKNYEVLEDGSGVRAHFTDGTTYEGEFLIGCEGAASNGALLPFVKGLPYPAYPIDC